MEPQIITSRAIRDRYLAALEAQRRYHNEAAEAYAKLHWWQWHKRRRLERVLFSGGGWRVALDPRGIYTPYVPERKR